MILKKLYEAKQVADAQLTAEQEAAFADAKKDFPNYRNDTLIELFELFKSQELFDEDVTFVQWLHNNSPLANIIFEFYNKIKTTPGRRSPGEISVHCIRDLLANDEILKQAFWNLALKVGDITPEGRENLTRRDPATNQILLGDMTTPEDICEDAFLLYPPRKEPERTEYLELYTGALKKAYLEAGGKLIECVIKEEAEEPAEEPVEIEEPAADVEIPEAPELQTEEPQEETSPEIKEKTYSDMINSAIQHEWDIISHLNSLIATFDYEYKEDNKEELLQILNQLVDDSTVNVGMLYKASELVSSKTSELISSGEEKAEEIISEE